MVKPIPVSVDSERAATICKMLLEGHTTTAIGTSFGKSPSWTWAVATSHGLEYDKTERRWKRKDESAVDTIGTWNLSTEDYEALLKPEREHTNGETPPPSEQQTERSSIDADIQEALDLLARAEQQRRHDMDTITRLQSLAGKSDEALVHANAKYNDLQTEASTLRNRVAQLETENKRLSNELKREISRGLLRQGMDGLRKVLPDVA